MPPGTRFRLSIWRPAINKIPKHSLSVDVPKSLTQVYCWEMHEELWASVPDSKKTNQLRTELIDPFKPVLPDSQRTIRLLRSACEKLNTFALEPSHTSWASTETVAEEGNDDEETLRANSVIALCNHLLWVCDTFEHVPNISVTIR